MKKASKKDLAAQIKLKQEQLGQLHDHLREAEIADDCRERAALEKEIIWLEEDIEMLECRQASLKKSCRCREPKSHPDCAYCGHFYAGPHVCGECKEAGIDGPVIRGTSRIICKLHKSTQSDASSKRDS